MSAINSKAGTSLTVENSYGEMVTAINNISTGTVLKNITFSSTYVTSENIFQANISSYYSTKNVSISIILKSSNFNIVLVKLTR